MCYSPSKYGSNHPIQANAHKSQLEQTKLQKKTSFPNGKMTFKTGNSSKMSEMHSKSKSLMPLTTNILRISKIPILATWLACHSKCLNISTKNMAAWQLRISRITANACMKILTPTQASSNTSTTLEKFVTQPKKQDSSSQTKSFWPIFLVMDKTGIFDKAIEEWDAMTPANCTWDRSQTHFHTDFKHWCNKQKRQAQQTQGQYNNTTETSHHSLKCLEHNLLQQCRLIVKP